MTARPRSPLERHVKRRVGVVRTFESAMRDLLDLLGAEDDEVLENTPGRVVRALAEMTSGRRVDVAALLGKTFAVDSDEMIVQRDISLVSLCEHHLLPFTGVAHVGYIPAKGGGVVGLSKLARLVDAYAMRLQVQERITTQVVAALDAHLRARGAACVVVAEHACMGCRGVRKPGSSTVTSALSGAMREPEVRDEFLRLAGL